jgi:osmotically inducible protein OsmC
MVWDHNDPTTPDPFTKELHMAATRRADMTWTGDLATGSGSVSASTSGAFSALPVSWPSRTEASDGQTSPEELVAAAHASCYAMAFSGILGRAGHPPQRLDVSAEVTFDKLESGWKVVSSALTVHGVVPGMSEADFVAAAEQARDGCPISGALKGNVELSVQATLEG